MAQGLLSELEHLVSSWDMAKHLWHLLILNLGYMPLSFTVETSGILLNMQSKANYRRKR